MIVAEGNILPARRKVISRTIRFSNKRLVISLFLVAIIVLGLAVWIVTEITGDILDPRSRDFISWIGGDNDDRKALIITQQEACPGAPFILPAEGFIGLLYNDPRGPYSRTNPHQGIDIFSPDRNSPGLVPVYAAYDGYIHREPDWRSTLIQRIPEDPLQPNRQIWLYYTHMADRDGKATIMEAFKPGVRELFVEQGTLLGYTGNYNGNSLREIWVHLHFSVVKDDGHGAYTNELEFTNTIDPSAYLGMALNYSCSSEVGGCSKNTNCS